MKGQFQKQSAVIMATTFASLLLFSGTPLLAADRSVSCEKAQSTYRVGAPGKGAIRKQECERVEFSAFEREMAEQEAISGEREPMKVGKPGYNRRPKNR